MAEGYGVTGVDFSNAMLELARKNLPDGDWRYGDMRYLEMSELFDGIVAWDSFFHLTPTEQVSCIPRLASRLVSGGSMMLTVGPKSGEGTGSVGEEVVYHASLSLAEYESLLNESGLLLTSFVAEDPECGYHSVLLARKSQASVSS